VRVRRLAPSPFLALLLAVVAIGCGTPREPSEIVQTYFRALGRDPARSLPLLSPAFHRHHGLRMARFEGWLWGWGPASAEAPGAGARAAGPATVEGAAFAWLYVQTHPSFPKLAATLRWSELDSTASELRAQVRVRVQGRGGASFVQRFELARRTPVSSWQIDRIDQIDVPPAARTLAFVAFPHDAQLDRLLRARE